MLFATPVVAGDDSHDRQCRHHKMGLKERRSYRANGRSGTGQCEIQLDGFVFDSER